MSEQGNDPRPTRRIWQQDNWLDKVISEAQSRGDFDNLPSHGKPLQIESNPLAPEWDMAMSVLKNADVAPYWVELGKEITNAERDLANLRDRTRGYLNGQLAARRAAVEPPVPPSPPPVDTHRSGIRRWWASRTRNAEHSSEPETHAITLNELEAIRQRARNEYLDKAAQLDAKIVAFHQALPRDLWRLQRSRRTAEQAAMAFDEAVPPVTSAAWEAIAASFDSPPDAQ